MTRIISDHLATSENGLHPLIRVCQTLICPRLQYLDMNPEHELHPVTLFRSFQTSSIALGNTAIVLRMQHVS